uniref:Lysoplasmalogenase TMEM86B n=1 Tax=Gopherus agassizii TaxID=38772 RepID=A0A452GXS8_9SAUR
LQGGVGGSTLGRITPRSLGSHRCHKLLPFLASCGLYFALWLPEPSWVSAGVKGLPLLSLVWFLTAQAWGDGAWTPAARRVRWGLMFSSVGDFRLVWPQLFIPGMGPGSAMLWPCLGGPYVPAVGGYGALLAAMAWRALARPPPHLAVATGSLLFVASDLVLAWDHFCAPVPQARLIVMGTYYAAQGLIAAWAPRASPRWKET